MSNIKAQYEQATSRLRRTKKVWDDTEDERDAYKEAALAAERIHADLAAKPGKKTPEQARELEQAFAAHRGALYALQDAAAGLRRAMQDYFEAQAVVDELKAEYDRFVAAEWRANAHKTRAEERARRADEGQSGPKADTGSKKRKRPAPQPKGITTQSIQDWHQVCVSAFLDKPSMLQFPAPPDEPCSNAGCALEAKSRALKACKCNIRKIFRGRTSLKKDRIIFHPDRFSTVPGAVRETIQQMAKEVFVVVDAMHQRS